MDIAKIRQIAEERQKGHNFFTGKGKRLYKEDISKEHFIGLLGEFAFAERYGLEVDVKIRPKGDNYRDFIVRLNDQKTITLDVKTSQKAQFIFVKEWEIKKCSDILILAKIFYETKEVQFIGWTTKKIMTQQPKKLFSHLNITSHYLERTKLNPMEDLDYLFNNTTTKQLVND